LHRITLDDAMADGLYKDCTQTQAASDIGGRAAMEDELLARYGSDADEELLCIPSRSVAFISVGCW